jgi:DNA-binding MarR family transcriptional regulator
MSAPNETIHQTVRLRVMAALTALPTKGAGLDFMQLKRLTEATDGNLGSHIDTLARAGYVEVEKTFVGRRPKTMVKATPAGRRAFADHVAFLQEVLGR